MLPYYRGLPFGGLVTFRKGVMPMRDYSWLIQLGLLLVDVIRLYIEYRRR